MVVYRRRSTQPFRWIVALILFVLAMTITFDVVEGIALPGDQMNADAGAVRTALATVTALIEESGLLLLACGLGALYLVRRRR